jgi:hypothetical protein
MLSITRPRFEVENNKVRRYTFGNGVSECERGVSGPKKITVGWVIFTVPRRKRVSQAVTAETARDRVEIAMETGSTIGSTF